MNNELDPTRRPLEAGRDYYSIGAASEATGISTETLRIWERRYGQPKPIRRESGHRRYTREQIIWLRNVSEALAKGNRPGQILRLPPEELLGLITESQPEPPIHREAQEMVDLVRRFDGEGFVERMRAAARQTSPLRFLVEWIGPVSQEIGRQWADGKLEIRHEHYATGLMEDFLRVLRAQFVSYPHGPRLLLTTLSGETHGLGMQMAALCCASEGVYHRVVGVDTPNSEILAAARESNVAGVAVSVSLATGGVETDRQLAELRSLLPASLHLVVGGEGARGIRRGPQGVIYIQSLEEWVLWLRRFREEWTRRTA